MLSRLLYETKTQFIINAYLTNTFSNTKVICNITLLSQRYKEVLIGLKGSKSILTFFSLPSSVTIVPQYTTNPLGGTKKKKKNQYY